MIFLAKNDLLEGVGEETVGFYGKFPKLNDWVSAASKNFPASDCKSPSKTTK